MDERHIEIGNKIVEGTLKAHKKMIRDKKEKGLDVIISRNGKIVRIPAKDL